MLNTEYTQLCADVAALRLAREVLENAPAPASVAARLLSSVRYMLCAVIWFPSYFGAATGSGLATLMLLYRDAAPKTFSVELGTFLAAGLGPLLLYMLLRVVLFEAYLCRLAAEFDVSKIAFFQENHSRYERLRCLMHDWQESFDAVSPAQKHSILDLSKSADWLMFSAAAWLLWTLLLDAALQPHLGCRLPMLVAIGIALLGTYLFWQLPLHIFRRRALTLPWKTQKILQCSSPAEAFRVISLEALAGYSEVAEKTLLQSMKVLLSDSTEDLQDRLVHLRMLPALSTTLNYTEVFREACRKDDLPLLQWLIDMHPESVDFVARSAYGLRLTLGTETCHCFSYLFSRDFARQCQKTPALAQLEQQLSVLEPELGTLVPDAVYEAVLHHLADDRLRILFSPAWLTTFAAACFQIRTAPASITALIDKIASRIPESQRQRFRASLERCQRILQNCASLALDTREFIAFLENPRVSAILYSGLEVSLETLQAQLRRGDTQRQSRL